MSSRASILAALDRCRTDGPAERHPSGSFAETLGQRTPLERFRELAAGESATSEVLGSARDVPAATAEYLRREGLAPGVVSALAGTHDWSSAGIEVQRPPVAPDGDVFVGASPGAVAEFGAFVLSSADHALADAFLAQTHIVVLDRACIHASLSELFAALRKRWPAAWPREFCLVTGPSRTADLGVPAKLGAHGPARVHLLVV